MITKDELTWLYMSNSPKGQNKFMETIAKKTLFGLGIK